MKRSVLLVVAFLFAVTQSSYSQRIEISSHPDNAHILVEGTSKVSDTKSRTAFESGGIFVYKQNFLPVYISPENAEESVHLDLVPQPDIIGDATTKKVEFSKLVVDMPSLKEIGSIGKMEQKMVFNSYVQRSIESNLDIWKELIEKELANRNVNMLNQEVDLFGGRVKKESADYMLGAAVTNMWISTTKRQSYTFVELKWSLFDKRLRKVVLETTSYGYGHGPEGKREHFDEAFESAATHLTCDEEFVAGLMGGASDDAENELETLNLQKIDELDIDMGSNLIKRCIASTVTILSDEGHGSGVIVSDAGEILTNFHVVKDMETVQVILSSGIELEAEVVRSDPYYDVALIKITTGKGYRPLPLGLPGDVPAYEVGDDVMAIGTPEFIELGQTVSRGVVSGNRMAEDRQFIQTDVSINPGNSGGPLINEKGEVIGLVTMKKFDSEGIGFAVPMDQTVKALNINYE